MRFMLVLLSILTATAAYAADKAPADKALILNDQDQKDFVNVLDAATRAQGLAIAPAAMRLLYKLQTAGTVTDIKPDDKPAGKPKEDKPQ